MWSCLGTFSLISGYLIGGKYNCNTIKDALFFYKKRVIRFFPLFFLSAILLCFIGFNTLNQTVIALLGLSPFISPRPFTLWYISMIMIFYLLSPIVLRGKRLYRCLLLFIGIVILSRFIDVDLRFIFNLFLYLVGICLPYYSSKILLCQNVVNKGFKMRVWGGNIRYCKHVLYYNDVLYT